MSLDFITGWILGQNESSTKAHYANLASIRAKGAADQATMIAEQYGQMLDVAIQKIESLREMLQKWEVAYAELDHENDELSEEIERLQILLADAGIDYQNDEGSTS